MKIIVPATTSNIASGFDVLGIALDMFLKVEFKTNSDRFSISGCSNQFCNEDNLIVKGIKKIFEIYNKNYWEKLKDKISIDIETEIPIARGLGSSASCYTAGMIFANEYLFLNEKINRLSKVELVKLGTELEGHPDNISAAILGGITSSSYDKEKELVYSQKLLCDYDFFDNFSFFVLIPPFEVKTEEARKILPQNIEFKDAVYNLSKLALLLTSIMNKDKILFANSFDDRLHQRYRSRLINNYDEIVEKAKICGAVATFISGSGSSIITIADKTNILFEEELKKSLIEIYEKYKIEWQIRKIKINQEGVKIINS